MIVAGGGLAGAAAACDLARAGARVVVLERSTGPVDKICGDFLSAEAQHYLARLGIDAAGLGGQWIDEVRIVGGGHVIRSALPFRGMGLSRRVLDEAVLARAAAEGAEVRRGAVVTRLDPGIRFLATGKHDLREGGRQPVSAPEDLVGFKTYLRLSPAAASALAGAVEVVLFSDGYAGLQMVEDGRANLCLLVHRDRLRLAGGTWAGLLADLLATHAHLRERLAGSVALLDRPLAIARVPYGFIHRAVPGETVFRLGDQAGVIPSFAGDGMAMALHSAALAVRCHLAGQSPEQYHRQFSADIGRPVRLAGALYRMGRTAPGQAAVLLGLRLWPGLLRQIARMTRVPAPVWVPA